MNRLPEDAPDEERGDPSIDLGQYETLDRPVVDVLYYLVAVVFFAWLFYYYLTTEGGPTLLAFTMVPITFVLFTLDSLRRGTLYPSLSENLNRVIAVVYCAIALTVSVYLFKEFHAIGTVRAGIWNATDLLIGGLMVLLVMEYARKRYFVLFVLNIVLILYAVYGDIVPGIFNHPGLSWKRIVTSLSLEDTTGVFSGLPQLALTLIGSFVLVLSVLRAFGCIDSILRFASRIAMRSTHALPQAAVMGSMGVAAVSGSGAANAVTTGSATIPALIKAGMKRENAAAVEAAASLGGQLMPPIMGISAFLMADFLGRSYFDVVARGYAPALVYFVALALGVYLISARRGEIRMVEAALPMRAEDYVRFAAFIMVVAGLIVLMSALHLAPIFAALYVFLAVGAGLFVMQLALDFRARRVSPPARSGSEDPSISMDRSQSQDLGAGGDTRLTTKTAILRFFDSFASMTADLTLLLATLSILTSAFVNTGVPPKVGFLLIEAASIHLAAMALVAFVFGALLGMGLPPAPTYILTALVIAPQMIKAGMDPWPVHFFAFFLAVWGELTPPTSVVAAVTSRIARASFAGTLLRSLGLCTSLFVLMAAVFLRPEIVLEPGLAQLAATALVLMAATGLTFGLWAKFSDRTPLDYGLRLILVALSGVALAHPDRGVAFVAAGSVAAFVFYWWRFARPSIRLA
ncbi:TRAP transporter permease [Thioalkalivibrio sp. HK1]|uniref:TRAP transporter permease n=1 Tax=Thioalkalivibrio sp. HK1 TaxID=1469245 RepID=UPI0018CC03A5|nr:TRAP transporter fused permease subunit [Thioalkalivibrio sp. HK1]